VTGTETLLAELGPLGLGWRPGGHASLTGPLYRLFEDCDDAFAALAGAWRATPERHPAMIEAAALQEIDYLHAFPHLATFPVGMAADDANLAAFAGRDPLDATGAVRLARTAPVREVLTPAACYHVYLQHRGETLPGPRHVTTVNTCFRREADYQPLRRQWSFRMREVVCLGTRAEVATFLERARVAVDVLCRELDLQTRWLAATDPFFRPAAHPRYLAQRLHPSKHEAVLGEDLAIASLNAHEDHFGAAFDIDRDGRPCSSGCLAFGVERWLYAVTRRHGADPANWPDLPAAGHRAAATVAAAPELGEE
jgi:seryl-tRNA synthetase